MSDKSRIKMGSNRSFGLVFFTVFFVIALWSFRGDFSHIKKIPFYISLFFLIFGMINSNLLTPLNKLWFKFGMLLGAIISPIVMGLVFFAVVTPIAFFMRLAGKDLLKKKYDKKNNSYWVKRDKPMGTMKRQF
tara:strand:- start:4689 stop:5087 length:399 start_codon:yes stop_codon:yes gene_type:complete